MTFCICRMSKWTSEKKEHFLELWSTAKALCDKDHTKYNDTSYGEKVVDRIANEVDMPCEFMM